MSKWFIICGSVLVLCIGSFVAGRYTAPQKVATSSSEYNTVETHGKVIEKTTTTKPDGTTIVVEIEKDPIIIEKTKIVEKKIVIASAKLNNRVTVAHRIDSKLNMKSVEAWYGRRVFGPVWVDMGFRTVDNSAMLGVSYEF